MSVSGSEEGWVWRGVRYASLLALTFTMVLTIPGDWPWWFVFALGGMLGFYGTCMRRLGEIEAEKEIRKAFFAGVKEGKR